MICRFKYLFISITFFHHIILYKEWGHLHLFFSCVLFNLHVFLLFFFFFLVFLSCFSFHLLFYVLLLYFLRFCFFMFVNCYFFFLLQHTRDTFHFRKSHQQGDYSRISKILCFILFSINFCFLLAFFSIGLFVAQHITRLRLQLVFR